MHRQLDFSLWSQCDAKVQLIKSCYVWAKAKQYTVHGFFVKWTDILG